MVQMTGNL